MKLHYFLGVYLYSSSSLSLFLFFPCGWQCSPTFLPGIVGLSWTLRSRQEEVSALPPPPQPPSGYSLVL